MRAAIADLTADRVLYRDLEPYDPQLPRAAALQASVGLPPGPPPRKRDQAYALIVRELAHVAQSLRGAAPLTTLVVIGDTANDRMLAENLADLGSPAVYGVIGVDRPDAAPLVQWESSIIATIERWSALERWAADLTARGVDWATTALLIDIDKTLLGPRGRCDAAIDDARADAALLVAADLLGDRLDQAAFRATYAQLCRSFWHPYTLDNQDYVTATTILALLGAVDLARIEQAITDSSPPTFYAVLAGLTPPPLLRELHQSLLERAAAGDPTPFKAFRRAELTATIARMADGRLTIGRELYDLAADLAQRGALCLAASDKPSESALPSPEQVAAGILPLHRMPAVLG